MMKKQNLDPNRSIRISSNKINEKKTHNISLNAISQSQQVIFHQSSIQSNMNSKILAQFKQARHLGDKLGSQNGMKDKKSATRNNYKPKFILKDLMQEKQLFSHDQNDSQSLCQEYFNKNQQENNISNTFVNSPLASESYYQGKKQTKYHKVIQNQNQNKSAVLTKRTYIEEDSKKTQDYQNTKNYGMPSKTHKRSSKGLKTQEDTQQHQYIPEYYEEGHTLEEMKKTQNLRKNQAFNQQKQTRIRTVSNNRINNASRAPSCDIKPQKNYKVLYLETNKKLQIRTAYFNEAMELCKHIIGNMKSALQEEFEENQSQRIGWCHERCADLLQAFEGYHQNMEIKQNK